MIGRSIATFVLVAVIAATAVAGAQDSTVERRPILIELRVGLTEVIGSPGRILVGPDAAVGVTAGTRLSPRIGGWFTADYRPSNSSVLYEGPDLSPAASLYTLAVGVSRLIGPAQGRARVRPVEVGLGFGATQASFEWRAYNATATLPPGAELTESPSSAGLLWSREWHPTAVARLRLVLPVGRVARLSATGALAATPVGDVRLWTGGWEPTGEGAGYRPSVQTWRYGTVVSVPLTVGVGVEF